MNPILTNHQTKNDKISSSEEGWRTPKKKSDSEKSNDNDKQKKNTSTKENKKTRIQKMMIIWRDLLNN